MKDVCSCKIGSEISVKFTNREGIGWGGAELKPRCPHDLQSSMNVIK